MIANQWADLTDGTLDASIAGDTTVAWTGVDTDGTALPGPESNCDGWSATGLTGRLGRG